MLCLACTMPFVASGENCLTSDTNGKKEKKKKRASPLNSEAKLTNLDKKTNGERGQKRDEKKDKTKCRS